MSSRRSIFLTVDNEHWYFEGRDESIVLEFSAEHKVSANHIGIEITIKEGTELHRELSRLIKK